MRFTLVSAAWLLMHSIQSTLGLVIRHSADQALAGRTVDLRPAATELRSQLSPNARITLPSDPGWDPLQTRASYPRVSPDYSVVVEVATENDVALVVKLANKYNIPFLAVSGAHGWTETLNRLPYGIQINMRKLNTTTLSRDGKTATVGGGTLQWEITRALFARGKYTVTGLAECVSAIGPLLGGGHSLLQNQYGFALDNMVSARVVLSNGNVVEASSTKNPDLFWALKGAGHNFGIITSFVVKTYNIPGTWTVYSFIFKQDKLEALFSLINHFELPSTPRPAKLALTGVFVRIPPIDANNPVIAYNVIYEGSNATAWQYASKFAALGPASTTISTNVDYVSLYTVTGNNLDSAACVKNSNILGSGASLPSWNLEGLRQAFNVFGAATNDPRFSTSIVLLENYGNQGVRAIDPASTALAPEERAYPVLASPVLWWEGKNDQAAKEATYYAARIREALYIKINGKRHTYVNYAIGSESLQELYGYESWRLEKLRRVKREVDPGNRFKFYNPLV